MQSLLFERVGSPLRWAIAVAALVSAGAHVPVTAPHLREAPYMGVLFIVLTVACVVLAVAALVRDTAAVYALSALTCGLAALGYAATRLVAFPMLADDVGNWWEPLGVAATVSEAVVVCVALLALRDARRTPREAGTPAPFSGPNSGEHPVARPGDYSDRRISQW
ncbi:MAG: hypothetical protein QOH17_3436 [Pseudonocardiales bacterium]|jgi:hypothetical protein|nr:hypothetical protein [Pseudonocardiales bacterium]